MSVGWIVGSARLQMLGKPREKVVGEAVKLVSNNLPPLAGKSLPRFASCLRVAVSGKCFWAWGRASFAVNAAASGRRPLCGVKSGSLP